MNKKKSVFSGLGVVVVLIASYFIYEHWVYVSTDNAQIEAHSIMMASKVGGFVKTVKVQEGDIVKKGDLLYEIDPRDYENTLHQVQSELLSLEAKKNESAKNFSRLSELYRTSAVSTQQYDAAASSAAEVKSKYEAISAQVAQAQLNLENTQIHAPADGVIAKKSVEVGQLASPGVPMIGFVESKGRWVVANFKETEIEAIQVGSDSLIHVDAISSREFKGHVESISPATGATFTLLPPDNATGNFTKVVQRVPVRIRFDDISEADSILLRAGLSADIKVKKVK